VDTESSRERGLSFPFRFVTALLPILSPIPLRRSPSSRFRGRPVPRCARGARRGPRCREERVILQRQSAAWRRTRNEATKRFECVPTHSEKPLLSLVPPPARPPARGRLFAASRGSREIIRITRKNARLSEISSDIPSGSGWGGGGNYPQSVGGDGADRIATKKATFRAAARS